MNSYNENQSDGISTDEASFGSMAIKVSKIINRLENLNNENNAGSSNSIIVEDDVYNFLNIDPKDDNSILSEIERLFLYDNNEELYSFLKLDAIGSMSIISHSLSTYMQVIDNAQFKKINNKIGQDLNSWLSRIFGLSSYKSFLHWNFSESIVQLVRYLFSIKFENYSTNCNNSFQKSNPIIYISSSNSTAAYQHICYQLGIPITNIHYIPVLKNSENVNTINLNELQKQFTEDLSRGDQPLIVIAKTGVFPTGHMHNLAKLSEICNTYGVWLHLKGDALAALSLPLNFNRQPHNIFRSVTLSIGAWLAIPGLPSITFYQISNEVSEYNDMEVILPGSYSTISYIPMWTSLQALGYNKMHLRIQNLFFYVIKFWKVINSFEQFRILSPIPKGDNSGVAYLVNHETNSLNLINSAITTVVFQYIPKTDNKDLQYCKSDNTDRLNSWLWSTLQLEIPKIPLEICNIEEIGLTLRFRPFSNVTFLEITDEDFNHLANFFDQQLIILETTVENKCHLTKLIAQSNMLRNVELPDWVGLGCVRYVPEDWESFLTNRSKSELNDLNQRLIDALRTKDSAFSMGISPDGFVCIRFGMLTPHSDVEELLDLIIKTGKSVEENSKVLETMSELVKKGIETATEDLQKENDEKLWHEGILRHIPVVGSFVNWWAPIQNESGIRGRSLNLREGVIESTENIYKYHMQVLSPELNKTNDNKDYCPSSPQVQKPLTVLINDHHKRTDSRTSNQSLKILESK